MPQLTIAQFDCFCSLITARASKNELPVINSCTDESERQRKVVQHVLQLHYVMQQEMDRLMKKRGKIYDIRKEMNNLLFSHINSYKDAHLR